MSAFPAAHPLPRGGNDLAPKLQNPDFLEPVLDERRPRRNWMFCAPQAKGMTAPGKEMDLCRHTRIIKSPRIDVAIADVVNVVIPCLQQERWRRFPGDVYGG